MDYTLSNSYDTDGGTGHRMHNDAKAIPTLVSGIDMNSVLWSLMEIANATGMAAMQFDKTNPASYRVILNALRSGGLIYGVDTGAANAMVVNFTPATPALLDGMAFWVKAKATNTGATTINVDGHGAIPVTGAAHQPLQGGEIVAAGRCWFIYSATLGACVLGEGTGGASQVAPATQSQHAPALGQFAGAGNYIKFPYIDASTGTLKFRIVQWGTIAITTNIGTSPGYYGQANVTYPITFNSGTSFIYVATQDATGAVPYAPSWQTSTSTGFTAFAHSANNGQAWNISWFAIGS